MEHLDQRTLRLRRDEALERMRNAGRAAVIGGVVSLLLFLRIGADTGEWSAIAPYLVSVAGTFALARGVFRRSQVAAVLLLLNFVAGLVGIWVRTGRPSGLLMAVVFGYFYFQGVRGAFDYPELDQALSRSGSAGPAVP